jgi:hypothetical protein
MIGGADNRLPTPEVSRRRNRKEIGYESVTLTKIAAQSPAQNGSNSDAADRKCVCLRALPQTTQAPNETTVAKVEG